MTNTEGESRVSEESEEGGPITDDLAEPLRLAQLRPTTTGTVPRRLASNALALQRVLKSRHCSASISKIEDVDEADDPVLAVELPLHEPDENELLRKLEPEV